MQVWTPQHRPSFAQGFARSQSEAKNPGLWNGLVGAWMPSLGVTGNGTLRDISGNAKHATLTDVTWGVDASGHFISGNALDISLPVTQSFSALSFSFWAKFSAFIYDRLWYTSDGTCVMRWYDGSSSAIPKFLMQRVSPWDDGGVSADGVLDSEWHHHVLHWNGQTMGMWIDGIKQSGTDTFAGTWTPTTGIYTADFGNVQCLGATAIYDRAISPSEIRQLYEDPFALTRQKPRYFSATVAEAAATTSLISVPRHTKPSYAQGFARSQSEAKNPGLWNGLVFAGMTSLGPTGGTLRDISGRNNHGTLTNMDPATDWVVTEKGWALDFDGTDDYISLGVAPISDDFTYSYWRNWQPVAASSSAALGTTDSESNLSNIRERYVGANYTIIYVSLSDYSNINWTYSWTGAKFYGWHHFTVTRSGSSFHLWLDGVDEGERTSAVTFDWSHALRIGAQGSTGQYYPFIGQIAHSSLYNRALTPAEIRHLYEDSFALTRQKPRMYSVTSGAAPAAFSPWWARHRKQTIGGGII